MSLKGVPAKQSGLAVTTFRWNLHESWGLYFDQIIQNWYKYTWCCRLVSAIITQISQEWYTNLYLRKNIFARIIPPMDSLYFVPYTLENFVNTSSQNWPHKKNPKHPGSRWEHPSLACNWTMCSCNLNADAAWPRPDPSGKSAISGGLAGSCFNICLGSIMWKLAVQWCTTWQLSLQFRLRGARSPW